MIHLVAISALKGSFHWKASAAIAAGVILLGAFLAEIGLQTWIAIAGVATGIVGAVVVPLILSRSTRRREENEKKQKTLDQLQQEVAALKTQMSPLWATIQAKLADALHHPHPESRELDGYLEKLEKLILKPDELPRLRQLLQEIIESPKPDIDEKAKAQMLLLAIPLATGERHNLIAADAKVKAAELIQAVVLPESIKPN
jgi:hypothetical protein